MKKVSRLVLILTIIVSLSGIQSCGGDDNGSLVDNLLGLTPENDVALGQNLVQQIESNPEEFPILPKADYPEAYSYIENMTAEILSSPEVKYKDIFPYEVKIIDKDVLNAFAAPGGFIYVYTGLIKYLDAADDLAGVMGHEIAHASERHSVDQMKQQLGTQFLISIALGEGAAADIASLASSFLSLKFGRDDETESDEFSVRYLSSTGYACNGAATFFEKLEEEGSGGPPEFLSTHPSPANRVENINGLADEVGCDTSPISEPSFTYDDFKNSLP
jgi:predicted Zn-dependent protease